MYLAKKALGNDILAIYSGLLDKARTITEESCNHAPFKVGSGTSINMSLPIHVLAQYVNRYCSLDKLSYIQCYKVAKFLNIPMPCVLPMSRVYTWADWVVKCDAMMSHSIIRSFSVEELLGELIMRGYEVDILNPPSKEVLSTFLEEHLEYTKQAFSALIPLNLQPGEDPKLVDYAISSIFKKPSDNMLPLSSLLIIRAASLRTRNKPRIPHNINNP